MKFYSVCVSVLLVAMTGTLSQGCTTTNDCDCGYVCVSQSDTLPCTEGERCTCKQGCSVASVYISPGSTLDVFCNNCSCLGDPDWHQGVPVCSKKGWCDLPQNVQLYQENINCE